MPVPITGDGPFWSYRLTTLGVGPGPVSIRKLTAGRLADAVTEAVTNPTYAQHAATLAADLATEDAAAAVLATVDDLIGRQDTERGGLASATG